MCSTTEMIRLYEYFVLHGRVLLSKYWRETCAEYKDQKEGNAWSDGLFAIIMKSFPCKHAVAMGDDFCSYLQKGQKKAENMNPKAFKAGFKVLFKLYDDLKAGYELTIGEKECHLIFCNAFSADYCNKFVQQQKEYHMMTMSKVVSFFQICHATDQPLHEQCQCEAAAIKEYKEDNQERDAANKKRAASHRNNSLSTGNNKPEKCGFTQMVIT